MNASGAFGILPKRESVVISVRVPLDVKTWLAAQAKRNISSQTAEIIRTLRDRMQREQREAVR